jgi:hypothetical protein
MRKIAIFTLILLFFLPRFVLAAQGDVKANILDSLRAHEKRVVNFGDLAPGESQIVRFNLDKEAGGVIEVQGAENQQINYNLSEYHILLQNSESVKSIPVYLELATEDGRGEKNKSMTSLIDSTGNARIYILGHLDLPAGMPAGKYTGKYEVEINY